MKTLYIKKENLLFYLNLNTDEYKHTLKVVDIKGDPDFFTLREFKLLESYLKCTNHSIKVVDKKVFVTSTVGWTAKEESLSELLNKRKKITNKKSIEQQKNEVSKETIPVKNTPSIKKENFNIEKINVNPIKTQRIKEIRPKVKSLKRILPIKIEKSTIAPKEREKSNIKKEITGVIGKEQKSINQVSKKEREQIINDSYAKSRYELYCEDCKKHNKEPVEFALYKKYSKPQSHIDEYNNQRSSFPIEHDYPFDDIWHYTIDAPGTNILNGDVRKVKSAKLATKVYNNGYVLYYSPKGKGTKILCKMDITKPFAANLTMVTNNYKYGIFDFYTRGEVFNVKEIQPTITNKGKEWTKEEDKIILDFYNSENYANANKKQVGVITLKELAKQMNIDGRAIRRRALELGFSNFKAPREKEWSKDELKLLKKKAGKYTFTKLEKIFREHGFTRSSIAIGVKIKRLNLSKLLDGSGDLNLKLLSQFMGVDSHYFYENNRLEKLNAYKENNQWNSSRENVRNYLIKYPEDYNFSKINPKWFVKILSEEPIKIEKIKPVNKNNGYKSGARNMEDIIEEFKYILCSWMNKRTVFDKDLAEILKIGQENFATMKNRGKIPYEEIIEFCYLNKIDLNRIFFHNAKLFSCEISEKVAL